MISTKFNKRNALKKGIALFVLLMLTAAVYVPALASDKKPNDAKSIYRANDVDLAGITEKDGRLSGAIKIFQSRDANQFLKVDCPVPQEFTAEQLNAITVEYKSFDKAEILAAMEKADGIKGQDDEKKFICEKNESYITLSEEGAPAPLYGEFVDDPLANSVPDTEEEKPEEMERAKQISLSFLKELGITPYEEGMNVARLFNSAAYGIHPITSDWKEQQVNLLRSFKRFAAEAGYTDFIYTTVRMTTMLRGLPVNPDFALPDNCGSKTDVGLTVKDGGSITHVSILDLPKEVSATPLATPAASWQDALKEWIATYYVDYSSTVDLVYDGTEPGNSKGAFTEYASYCVLKEIKPVYISRSKSVYKPGWCFVVEQRLNKDDSLIYVRTYALDATTLTDLWTNNPYNTEDP